MSYTFHVNHLGYELGAPKRAVVSTTTSAAARFRILREPWRMPVWQGDVGEIGPVARWKRKEISYGLCDFSSFDEPGVYRLAVGDTVSEPFAIQHRLLWSSTAEAILRYFRGQRCRGAYDEADRRAAFFGEERPRVDVHGGWYDASGDISKYLSHLSYANFMNPQQTPMVVYNLLGSADLVREDAPLAATMRKEAAYGGDFLVRMQDPAGYFYATIFDRWSKKLDERLICAFKTQKGDRLPSYKAAYRQGAGVAIAALARLAASEISGEYSGDRYLEVAERGFAHLEAHNALYLPDGRENIIDDYCALLAAAELFAATSDARYHAAAERRAGNLIGRLTRHPQFGVFWRADDAERPFFHAAEAGLPVVALLRWAEQGSTQPDRILAAVRESLLSEVKVTEEVANPFGYARQYVQSVGQPPRSSFFYPHENESGYWWQGENARLASLATAAALALPRAPFTADEQRRVGRYAVDQLDWIFGKNPFDSCMIFGFGRGSADYLEAWPNYPGGICNGVTSGFDDEEDIDFLPAAHADDILQNWRWSEQWIPHAAWFLFALAAGRASSDTAGAWMSEPERQRREEPSSVAKVESSPG